jgi:MarR family transcriptional regulator, organic hydroperoxide resistance regulator
LTIVVRTSKFLNMTGSSGKPSGNIEEEVFLHLQRTADAALRALEALLKPHGLTHTQYNVLRILRGAGEPGLLCREIGGRMITRDPDVTRLLDRMEAHGLIARGRGARDRRVILTRITPKGLRLLDTLDRPVQELHRRRLAHLSRANLKDLLHLLESARGGS